MSQLLTRTTHKAQAFTEEQMQGFSMLSHQASAIAIGKRMTGSQYRLWHYLMMIDPFADRNNAGDRIFHQMPSPADMAKAIGSSLRTVQKDLKRLTELGIYVLRRVNWQGYNLSVELARTASENMKQARAQAKSPPTKQPQSSSSAAPEASEPLQDESGYLDTPVANQPEPPAPTPVEPIIPPPPAPPPPEASEPLQDESGYLNTPVANQPEPPAPTSAEPVTPLTPETPEPLQNGGGYLTTNPANQPLSRLDNQDGGYLARPENAENLAGSAVQPLSAPDQTYTDFLSDLQQTERERFKEFARKEAESLQRPRIVLIETWIANHYEELWREFQRKSPPPHSPLIEVVVGEIAVSGEGEREIDPLDEESKATLEDAISAGVYRDLFWNRVEKCYKVITKMHQQLPWREALERLEEGPPPKPILPPMALSVSEMQRRCQEYAKRNRGQSVTLEATVVPSEPETAPSLPPALEVTAVEVNQPQIGPASEPAAPKEEAVNQPQIGPASEPAAPKEEAVRRQTQPGAPMTQVIACLNINPNWREDDQLWADKVGKDPTAGDSPGDGAAPPKPA